MSNKNEKCLLPCDTCAHHFIIGGCPCCGKCAPKWYEDGRCDDYEMKREVTYEKKNNTHCL